MKLIPAIDLLAREAVRLYKGDYEKKTVYGDPISIAQGFKDAGATLVHLVDLDGAKAGISKNFESVRKIMALGLSVELGGGIRSRRDIARILACGVKRVIIGSLAAEEVELVPDIIKEFGSDRVVVSIDTRDGYVATRGWTGKTDLPVLSFAQMMASFGVRTIIYTDISRDGTLSGPALKSTKELVQGTNLSVIASGGIRNQEDLDQLREIGVDGVILGKALYEGMIDLEDALKKEASYAL